MIIRAVLILAASIVLHHDSTQAAFQLGYTAESCDDLRPQRVPFVQDLMAGGGQPIYRPDGTPVNFGGPGGFNQPVGPSPNSPGSFGNQPRPDGINIQPILMTTVTPYRIWVSENRYKRGKVMEGSYIICLCPALYRPSDLLINHPALIGWSAFPFRRAELHKLSSRRWLPG